MHAALRGIIIPLVAATLCATGGCHNEPDCGGQTLPAGVELEIALTRVSSNEGCDGLGATLDDEPVRYATGEPVNVGAHNKCLAETLEPPSDGELYGVSIDFCIPIPAALPAKVTWRLAPSKVPGSTSRCISVTCRRAAATAQASIRSIFRPTNRVAARPCGAANSSTR